MGKIRIRISAVAAVLLLALSACASSQGGPSGGSSGASGEPSTAPTSTGAGSSPASPGSPSAGPSSSAGPHSDLTIDIRESPEGTSTRYILVCDGTSPGSSSTVEDPAAACVALEKYGPAAFAAPTVQNRKCTMQYGTSRVATVSGTLHGSSVRATFSQTDGCQIATWNSLSPLFGSKAGEL
ncbi:MAG: hypothetical protein M3017_11125 [Actinomycetota bacterium]|nr:hypothetical protein [Actinomycetota bacterium]